MRTARSALIVLMVTALARLAIVYGQLPETVPSHFDISGQPDGWSGRGEFVVLYAFLVLLMGSTFIGVNWLIRKVPRHMVNLPNRDYWLAEGREEETLDDLESRMLWMGVVSVVFLIAIQELSIRIALSGANRLPSAALLSITGGYMAVLSIQTLALLIRYSRKPPG